MALQTTPLTLEFANGRSVVAMKLIGGEVRNEGLVIPVPGDAATGWGKVKKYLAAVTVAARDAERPTAQGPKRIAARALNDRSSGGRQAYRLRFHLPKDLQEVRAGSDDADAPTVPIPAYDTRGRLNPIE